MEDVENEDIQEITDTVNNLIILLAQLVDRRDQILKGALAEQHSSRDEKKIKILKDKIRSLIT